MRRSAPFLITAPAGGRRWRIRTADAKLPLLPPRNPSLLHLPTVVAPASLRVSFHRLPRPCGIDGSGLTAVVTGASSGIGVETCRVLASRGVHVVMGVRNVSAGAAVKNNILERVPNAKIDILELDLGSKASVRKFASEFDSSGLPLNILINNAGVGYAPFKLSEDGIEHLFAINHLGHFLLTELLLENLKVTAKKSNIEGRIVIVASLAHTMSYREGIRFDKINDPSGYSNFFSYGQSKLANILHANELSRVLKEQEANVTVNSLHPGAIVTNILRHHKLLDEWAREDQPKNTYERQWGSPVWVLSRPSLKFSCRALRRRIGVILFLFLARINFGGIKTSLWARAYGVPMRWLTT